MYMLMYPCAFILYACIWRVHTCLFYVHAYYIYYSLRCIYTPLVRSQSSISQHPFLYIGPKRHLIKRPGRRDFRLSVGDRLHRRLSTHIHGAVEEVDDAYFIALTV